MSPARDPLCLYMPFLSWFRRSRPKPTQDLVVGHLKVILKIRRKVTTREPFLQELLQVDVVDTPNWVKIQLRVHEVASPEQGLRRLKERRDLALGIECLLAVRSAWSQSVYCGRSAHKQLQHGTHL